MNKQLRRPIKHTAAHINGLLPIFTSEMTIFTKTSQLYSLSPIHAHLGFVLTLLGAQPWLRLPQGAKAL